LGGYLAAHNLENMVGNLHPSVELARQNSHSVWAERAAITFLCLKSYRELMTFSALLTLLLLINVTT